MGIECGFDIYPRLDADSMAAYHEFVEEVLDTYERERSSASFRKNGQIIRPLQIQITACLARFASAWVKLHHSPMTQNIATIFFALVPKSLIVLSRNIAFAKCSKLPRNTLVRGASTFGTIFNIPQTINTRGVTLTRPIACFVRSSSKGCEDCSFISKALM
jgi:hypothetical protein